MEHANIILTLDPLLIIRPERQAHKPLQRLECLMAKISFNSKS